MTAAELVGIPRSMVPSSSGQLADYFGVSEEKLRALPQEKVFELHQSGALEKIYNHLSSLIGWDRLIAIAAAQAAAAQPAAANLQ